MPSNHLILCSPLLLLPSVFPSIGVFSSELAYSQYLQLRAERREQQQKQYEEQQKMIAETKDFR